MGTYTYTTDQRFQTTFHREINEWTLHIKWAQKRDAGMYECQISTQPIKSYSVRLNVVGKLKLFHFFFRFFGEIFEFQSNFRESTKKKQFSFYFHVYFIFNFTFFSFSFIVFTVRLEPSAMDRFNEQLYGAYNDQQSGFINDDGTADGSGAGWTNSYDGRVSILALV